MDGGEPYMMLNCNSPAFLSSLILSHRGATWVVNGEMHALEVRGKQDRETTQAVSNSDSCRKGFIIIAKADVMHLVVLHSVHVTTTSI